MVPAGQELACSRSLLPHLGSARSGELFDKVKIEKKVDLPRDWTDYTISIEKSVPQGVELIELL